VAVALAAPAADAMSRARAIAVMALSLTALRALPAQDRAVHVMPVLTVRLPLPDPNDRVAKQWTERGRALYDSTRYRESIASFERALQLRAGRPDEHAWNIARAYAHLGNRKQALRWLSHALEMGFPHRDAIADEAAFDQYRGDARYLDILENAAKPVVRKWNAAKPVVRKWNAGRSIAE
jgi:tetratricopeptide (TPR) repeat protein